MNSIPQDLFTRIQLSVGCAFLLVAPPGFSAAPEGWLADGEPSAVQTIIATRGQATSRSAGTTSSISDDAPPPPRAKATSVITAASFTVSQPDEVTSEIQALARSLLNSPANFFIFVLTQCDYEHYYGFKRGAQGALLERRGNDADLSALLVALLKAANYSPVYRYGVVGYLKTGEPEGRDFENWLGVSDARVATYNGLRGYPATYSDGGSYRALHRVWVQVQVGTSTYWFDPAFRKRTKTNGLLDIAASSGYSRSNLDSASGGAIGADFVESLSESGASAYLTARATSVVQAIDADHHGALASKLHGGWDHSPFIAANGSYYTWHGDVWDAVMIPETWTSIPDDKLSKVTIEVKSTASGNPVLFSVILPMTSLQCRKLALTFTASDASGKAQLWLDDTLLGEETTAASGTSVLMRVALHHPHTNSLGTDIHDQESQKSYRRGSSYAITYAFTPNADMIKRRQEKLDGYRRAGLSDSSREVLTETLNIMGLVWMHQTDLVERMLGGMKNCDPFDHHRFGRVGQETNYYVDVDLQFNGLFSMDGAPGSQAQARDAYAYFASAMEHGVIDQTMGATNPAVSTVRVLRLANQQPAGSRKLFYATSANWASIQSQLQGYGSAELAEINDTVINGGAALVPQKGNIGLNQWSGAGYITKLSSGDSVSLGMNISGNLNGGFGSKPGTVDAGRTSQLSNSNPNRTNPQPINNPSLLGADPVDMASGDYYYPPAVDLSLGEAAPRGLVFSRAYHGNRRWVNAAGLGYGWTHNWHMRAVQRSAYEPALGLNGTPQDVASALVACHVITDLMSATPNAKNWAMSAMVAHWLADQLQDNSISVSLADKSMQFVKRPDGLWQPPGGSTTSLTMGGLGWEVTERHGNTYRFDQQGRIAQIVDLWGKELIVGYNGSGKVQLVLDAYGRSLTFNYTTPTILESVSDNTGRTVTFWQDGNSDLIAVTDTEGENDKFVYDTEHRVTQVKNHDDQIIVSNIHDTLGRVIEQRTHGDAAKAWKYYYTPLFTIEENPKGTRKTFNFDQRKRHTSTVSTLLGITRTWQTVFDGQDRAIEEVSPLGRRTVRVFDRYQNLRSITDPENKTVTLDYDAQHRLTRRQDHLGHGLTYTYNTQHQVLTETNDENEVTTRTYNPGSGTLASEQMHGSPAVLFQYNARDELETTTHPNGDTESMVRNTRGDITSITDGRGKVMTMTYNLRRQPLVITRPGNNQTTNTYDNSRNLASVTDPRGKLLRYFYSPTGKLTETRFPDGTSVFETYDERDWSIRKTDEMSRNTDFLYWSTGELRRITDPELRKTDFTYDNDSRQNQVTNNASETTVTQYDGRDLVTKVTDPLSRVSENTFDSSGKKSQFKNRRGNSFAFGYDLADRLETTTSPMGRVYGQAFNNKGLLGTATEPSGQTTGYTYDQRRRVVTRTDAVGTATMTYDANSNVTKINENGRDITRTFDDLNRVETYSDGRGHTINYGYDENGNQTSITYEAGKSVTMEYDDRNRLTKVTDWTGRITTLEYWPDGRLRSVSRPNGTKREVSWTPSGLLDQVNDRLTTTGIPVVAVRCSYDTAGRMKNELILPKWPNQPALPARNLAFNADNQITTVNGQNAAHDADGNLTSGPPPTGGVGPVSYGWNARNQLASGPGGMTYGYDAEGQRESYTVGGQLNTFVNDPNSVLPRVLIRIAPDGRKTYCIYGRVLLYEIDGATNQATYLHYDHLGCTIALTNDSGQVTGRAFYSAYGQTVASPGTLNTPFLWQGAFGIQTDPNGLLYMRARYYHPWLGRFISEDPLRLSAGPNFFAYCNGDPLAHTDSTGLWFGIDDLIFAGGGALVSTAGLFVANVVTGKDGTWEDYVGAALGGAAGGETLLYTANPIAAGAVGGAVGNASTQGLKLATGKQDSFSVSSLAADTGIGTLTGLLHGAKIPGISAGRGSDAAVFKQIVTKAGNSSINTITTQTAVKMASGAFVPDIVSGGAILAPTLSNLYSDQANFLWRK